MMGAATHRFELALYKAKIGVIVRVNNMKARGAFDYGMETPSFTKVGAFAVMAVFALSVISWAVTAPVKAVPALAPTLATLTPPLSAPLVSPKEAKAPEADPYAMVFRDIRDLSELPPPRRSMPAPSNVSLHTVVVDKSRRELFVLEETQDNYKIVARYPVSLGSERGDKMWQGDNRTPEGLYTITEIKNGGLPQKYGPRAYVLNYPNELDHKLNKTGYGIWLHGSGMGDKTKPTEGCVQLNDFHVIEIGQYIGEGSPVYIFPEGFELPIENDAIQKNVIRPETLYALKEWRDTTMAQKEGSRTIPTIMAGG